MSKVLTDDELAPHVHGFARAVDATLVRTVEDGEPSRVEEKPFVYMAEGHIRDGKIAPPFVEREAERTAGQYPVHQSVRDAVERHLARIDENGGDAVRGDTAAIRGLVGVSPLEHRRPGGAV